MSDEQRRADELVSAYLDGEATPTEIAEVEQDDALSARVDQLGAVRDASAAPVAPMPAESRDRMIEAVLAEAVGSDAQQQEARIVPIHRRHPTLLAVAAAAVLLSAAVSAGLIASRGGDDLQTAAEAPAETAEAETAATETAATETAEAGPAATETAEASAEESMAGTGPGDTDMAAASAEESMAAPAPTARSETAEADTDAAPATARPELAEAPAADETPAAEEARVPEADEATAESEAAQAAAETAEAAMAADAAAPADDDAAAPEMSEERGDADTVDAAESGDGTAGQVVDLGVFENLESLLDDIAARWSDAVEDGAVAGPGSCSAAVRDAALESGVEAGQPFIAAVGAGDPLLYDARFVRRADGTAAVVYAAPPDCETAILERDSSNGS